MYLKGVSMEIRSDLELIALAKSSDEKTALEAQYSLWNKYQFFIKKKYFQWLNTFSREHIEFEEFVQEAYIAFAHALELCDLDRMKEKNVNNFSTVLYFQLMKLKNKYDTHYVQYGHVYSYSELASEADSINPEEKYSGTNTISGQWIAATSIDPEIEQRKYMCENLIKEYQLSLNTIDKKICQLLIERKKISNIIEMLSSQLSESEVRSKVNKIKSGLKNYVEMNAYV